MPNLLRLEPGAVDALRVTTRSYGFGALRGAMAPALLEGLRAEATRGSLRASLAERTEDFVYRAGIAPLGRTACRLLRGRSLARLLLTVFGRPYVLNDKRSCLTCYGPGSCLGPHLDEPAAECCASVIVYVAVARPPRRVAQTGLQLNVYGSTRPCQARPRLVLPTRRGDVVVGRGSLFWHERSMLVEGERVLALTACFQRLRVAS